MTLGPLHEPLAEQTPGTERDFGLNNLITGPQRIAFRVQKGQNPVLLIIHQSAPNKGKGAQAADDPGPEYPGPGAGQEYHPQTAQRQ